MKRAIRFHHTGGAAIGLLLLAGSISAADHWLVVEGSNCKAWSEEALKPGEVIRWSGGCEDGRLSGKGLSR